MIQFFGYIFFSALIHIHLTGFKLAYMMNKVGLVGADKEYFAIVKKNLLKFYPDISWIEFENGYDIVNYCLNNKELPQVIFTEMFLLKIDGITLTDYLSTYLPDIQVVCVVDDLDTQMIQMVSEVGATGIMNKSDPARYFRIIYTNDDLCRIMETALHDLTTKHPTIHEQLGNHRDTILKKFGVTKRESLFLLLNATGLEYREIAALMFISKKTVDNLFNSVAKKFGVQNRHNLTLFCFRMRLIKFSTVKTTPSKSIVYH